MGGRSTLELGVNGGSIRQLFAWQDRANRRESATACLGSTFRDRGW